MTDSHVTREAVEGRKPEWPGLRKLADHLYEIFEDGFDKTAAEVESEMQVYLLGELAPLLKAIEEACTCSKGLPDGACDVCVKILRERFEKIFGEI
jgi:hypothetical protein